MMDPAFCRWCQDARIDQQSVTNKVRRRLATGAVRSRYVQVRVVARTNAQLPIQSLGAVGAVLTAVDES